MNAKEEARQELEDYLRLHIKPCSVNIELKRDHLTECLDDGMGYADAYAAAAVAGALADPKQAEETLLLLEWLARRGDDPIWQGLQVNYCLATGAYTYFGYRASREITRAEALALLKGGAGDKGRGTNNITCNP